MVGIVYFILRSNLVLLAPSQLRYTAIEAGRPKKLHVRVNGLESGEVNLQNL